MVVLLVIVRNFLKCFLLLKAIRNCFSNGGYTQSLHLLIQSVSFLFLYCMQLYVFTTWKITDTFNGLTLALKQIASIIWHDSCHMSILEHDSTNGQSNGPTIWSTMKISYLNWSVLDPFTYDPYERSNV